MRGGSFLPTYRRQPKAIKPFKPLPALPTLGAFPRGQRTMPVSGAPFLPANPLLKTLLQYWKGR